MIAGNIDNNKMKDDHKLNTDNKKRIIKINAAIKQINLKTFKPLR